MFVFHLLQIQPGACNVSWTPSLHVKKRFILSFKPWLLIDRYNGQQVQHCSMLAALSCQQASTYFDEHPRRLTARMQIPPCRAVVMSNHQLGKYVRAEGIIKQGTSDDAHLTSRCSMLGVRLEPSYNRYIFQRCLCSTCKYTCILLLVYMCLCRTRCLHQAVQQVLSRQEV